MFRKSGGFRDDAAAAPPAQPIQQRDRNSPKAIDDRGGLLQTLRKLGFS